ncbi:MAG: hypothetical protein Q9P01_14755 [Anaerolineae bacterium]|nr:hypothetical protein [Anaerolineae bacterium]
MCRKWANPAVFRIGTKSITVAISPSNDFIDSLSTAELQVIFRDAPRWSDIRPEWSQEIIERYGTGVTSLEVTYFAQAVFGGDSNILTTALGAQYNDDPDVALNGVAVSPNAIGIFDSGYVNENRDFVRPVIIDGVEPRFDTISSGAYPLSRPLYLYSSSAIMQEKRHVAEFINYYLQNLELEFSAVNLFPADVATQQIAINTWFAALGQSVVEPTSEAPPPTATEEIAVIDPLPEPTAIAPDSREPVLPFAADVIPLLIATRTDLEVMATEVLGIQRTPGWSGSLDINDPQLALLVRLDLELLSAVVYGDSRPESWFGAVGSTQLAIVRDIRHDLEVIADTVYTGQRPTDWVGGDPLYRCNRATQALVAVLQRTGLYSVTANSEASDYCQQVENDVSRYAELNLVGESGLVMGEGGEVLDINREAEIVTEYAVAFLTRNAEPSVGIMPVATQLTPIGRSYVTGSNMTLIEGLDYLVFVEYINTDLTGDEWERLPNIDDIEAYETYCQAIWCR